MGGMKLKHYTRRRGESPIEWERRVRVFLRAELNLSRKAQFTPEFDDLVRGTMRRAAQYKRLDYVFWLAIAVAVLSFTIQLCGRSLGWFQ